MKSLERGSVWCCQVLVAGVLLSAAPARAENWPQFRGGDGTGVGLTTAPVEWSSTQNIAWKVAVPGAAWSQPIIWGDKVFLTTAVTENQRKPAVGGGRGGFGGGFGPRPSGPPPGERPAGELPSGERPATPPGAPRPGFGGPGFGGPGRPGGFGGRGGSAPEAVYQWKVLCLDRNSGKTLWEQKVKEAKPTIPTHSTNTFASETPVTDGERLYCYFGMTGLYCLDLNGKELWNKDLGSYPMSNGWGTGSSPVLVDDKLLILCDNEQQSFLAALDKKTGSELWRVSRDERSTWGTPFVWKNKTRTELVVSGATTRSYDPATGKQLWSLGGNRSGARSSPVANAELLYVGTGGGMGGNGPLTAIKAGASGDLDDSPASIAWTISGGGAAMASPLLYEGGLYVLDQRGGVCACYDALSGKLHYKERLPSATGFTSSPWATGGKVFCLDQSGQTYVLQPGAEFKVLHVNKLDDTFWSSVAVTETQLLLRGNNNLYCISGK